MKSSVPATQELRDQILAQAKRMQKPLHHSPEVAVSEGLHAIWVPTCTVPNSLWKIYRGEGADSIVTSAYAAGKSDLAVLSPPDGLDQTLFQAYISGILRQMPFILEILSRTSTGFPDSQAHKFLLERLDIDVTKAETTWIVLKRWILHFFKDSYRIEPREEVLVKGKELPSR